MNHDWGDRSKWDAIAVESVLRMFDPNPE